MSKTFGLAALVPEPLTFCDDAVGGDGKKYDVKTTAMLGAVDTARMDRMSNRLPDLLQETGDEEGTAAELESILNDFVALLVIGMEPARIEKIPFGFKLAFIEWWKGEASPFGKTKAPPETAPA